MLAALTAPLAVLGVLLAGAVVAAFGRAGLFGWSFVAVWMAPPVALRTGALLLGAWAVAPILHADARWLRQHAGYVVGLLFSELLLHASGRAGMDIDRPTS